MARDHPATGRGKAVDTPAPMGDPRGSTLHRVPELMALGVGLLPAYNRPIYEVELSKFGRFVILHEKRQKF